MARVAQKLAVIVAATVEVQCPACGAEQPSPGTGSDLWPVEELRWRADSKPDFDCVSCDHKFKLILNHKVNLP